MNPVVPMPINPIDLETIPELSRVAWERLITTMPSDASCSNLSIEHLQIACLPSVWQIAAFPTDDWVIQYEKLRETLERKQRKQGAVQTGVFYTPVWVAQYLVRQTLGQYLTSSLHEMKRLKDIGESDKMRALIEQVQALRVLDPACGTGVFLVEALKALQAFYQQAEVILVEPVGFNPVQYAFSHQLYGIDIDPMSVMITELRLAQWVYRLDTHDSKNYLLNSNSHVICADTLSNAAFSEPCHWDFILGNPPYVSETRKQSQRFQALQAEGDRYYRAKMDLCDAFVMWSIEHLNHQGQFAFVLPEYWTQRSSSQALRSQLWQQGHLLQFWRFAANKVFKNAPGHHTSLVIWQKHSSVPTDKMRHVQLGAVTDEASLSANQLQAALLMLDELSGKLLYGNSVELKLLQKLTQQPPLLKAQEIQQGLVIPQGRLKKSDAQRLSQYLEEPVSEQAGVFLLNELEIRALHLNPEEQKILKPYYQPAGFRAFQGFLNDQPVDYILYGNLKNRKLIESQPEIYLHLRAHLDRFRTINTSAFSPYGLHRARQSEWFEEAHKILCPRQVMVPAFAVVDFTAYVNEGFYSILTEPEDAYYLCGILNSKLAWFWFYNHKRKGRRLQIDKDVLAVFPKPPIQDNNLRNQIHDMAYELSQTGDERVLEVLNRFIYQLYQLQPDEIDFIESAYLSNVVAE